MPVRKVVRPTGRGVRGHFPSRKMGRMIAWESLLERDAILRFEFSAGVIRYEEQPANIYYEQDGKTHRYIPDFELTLQDGVIMHIEVKPHKKLEQSDNKSKYAAIAKHYADMGVAFRILTEMEIRSEPSLSNLQRLARYIPRDENKSLDTYLESLVLLPAQTLGGAVVVCGDELPVYQLLAAGRYSFDLNEPLSIHTNIYPRPKESKDAALLF